MSPGPLPGRLAAALIAEQARRSAALTVGVTGADASGKTRFAGAVADRLLAAGARLQLVHVDDFHRPRAVRYAGDLPEPQKYLRQSIDLEQLARQVLEPIRTTGRLHRTIRHLDLVTDQYRLDRTYDVDERTIVLVEGVFLLRPPVRALLHRIVFLHVTDEEAIRRGSTRDQEVHAGRAETKFREKFLPAQRLVFTEHPPEQWADLIIDNTRWTQPLALRWAW
jgi:uridine kinase